MSDEEEDASEGFSASEDEWKPSNARGGESSDDDDSDFEEVPPANARGGAANVRRRSEQKSPSGIKAASMKKRKPSGQSLRAKLFKQYRPPPKTAPMSPSNSPSASGSKHGTASKNSRAPNEGGEHDGDSSSGESSVCNYLVHPDELDLNSSYFNVPKTTTKQTAAPIFDCNADLGNISDSDSEDNNDSSVEQHAPTTAYDFRGLLEKTQSLERAKEKLAERSAETNTEETTCTTRAEELDVAALLALGENANEERLENAPPRLSKTKSTRIKRHTKTRPTSTVIMAAVDTDDSDWEEVSDEAATSSKRGAGLLNGNNKLEIHIEISGAKRSKEEKTKDEQELAFRRKINREIREKQIVLHKDSLLSSIARSTNFNRVVNDQRLMQAALKLLPSANAYPRDTGTEIKYFESFVTWFKTVMKLTSQRQLPAQCADTDDGLVSELIDQIKRRQARSKQDYVLIFVALARGMAMHCRLIVNLQPVRLKPDASELLSMKLGGGTKDEERNKSAEKPKRKETHTESDGSEAADEPEAANTKSKKHNQATKDKVGPKPKKISKSDKDKALPASQESPEKPSAKSELDNLKASTSNGSPKVEIKRPKIEAFLHVGFTPIARRTRRASRDGRIVPLNDTVNTRKELGSKVAAVKPKSLSQKLSTKISDGKSKQQKKTSASSISQLDGGDDVPTTKRRRPKLEKLHNSRSNNDDDDDDDEDNNKDDSDEDFEASPPKRTKKAPALAVRKRQSTTASSAKKDRRVLSSDDSPAKPQPQSSQSAADMWVELWSDKEMQWICADLFKPKVNSVESIRKSASSPLVYVFAFQNDLSLKDVTARYCPNWGMTVRKQRVDKLWLNDVLEPYLGERTERDIREDDELRRIHEERPLPTSISEYKDHPLYVLERHLLKFQGIYPPDAPPLGYVRGEPVYSRDCVHLLHSREIWLKEARVVKLSEQPYKIVKARPKWDRASQSVIKDQPLEIFGYWQTEDYDPPTAEDGIVPRNAYGNVELFKECMLPKKTVHLRLPGLQRICRKLDVDCANAVIGFDFHQGACHPLLDGFVVCEEFKDLVVDAWHEEQVNQERREQEKYEARVFGNWKKLIKGLLIRERLKAKYNF